MTTIIGYLFLVLFLGYHSDEKRSMSSFLFIDPAHGRGRAVALWSFYLSLAQVSESDHSPNETKLDNHGNKG
jgi:hypothetical protein